MRLTVELDREEDGRWIADVPELPGASVYGSTRDEAVASAKALALRVLADRLEHGEAVDRSVSISSPPLPMACRLFRVSLHIDLYAFSGVPPENLTR